MAMTTARTTATLKWVGIFASAIGVVALGFFINAIAGGSDVSALVSLGFGALGCLLSGGGCLAQWRARTQTR